MVPFSGPWNFLFPPGGLTNIYCTFPFSKESIGTVQSRSVLAASSVGLKSFSNSGKTRFEICAKHFLSLSPAVLTPSTPMKTPFGHILPTLSLANRACHPATPIPRVVLSLFLCSSYVWLSSSGYLVQRRSRD